MDHDHVATDQFLATGHPLPGDQAVMDDELQVEPGDVGAGVAVALRRLADVAQAPPEGDVAVLDRVLEDRSVDHVGDDVGEGRVALEFGQSEGRPERANDGVSQVGQDVLRVIEFDAREVARVAADVGEDETRGLRLVGHCDPLQRRTDPTRGYPRA